MVKVMIVDDALFMRKMLTGILESQGHTVVCEAANGEEAISQYQKFKPELVTMDITMPVMNGIEAVKGISVVGDRITSTQSLAKPSESLQERVLEAFKTII